MDVKITPSKLAGEITIPPSKSVAHRLIISAALAKGKSEVTNVYPSKDIVATIEAMKALGAQISVDGDKVSVEGIENPPESAIIDCCESGSTLRFLIPVAAALGVKTTFLGSGLLPQRPITPYLEELPKHGVKFDYDFTMPFSIEGKLTGGKFYVDGKISSQFITGLIFALAILEEDSEIILTSHLESRPYVDITIGCLKDFGCEIKETEQGYYVKGGQILSGRNCEVEGDYSQAAFFEVANSLGSDVKIKGLNVNSSQGDKKIVEICRKIVYNKNDILTPFDLDCSDTPDLVPILTVLACFCNGVSNIRNVARLRIKECDRLEVTTNCLNSLGAKVTAFDDRLEIVGVKSLTGGTVDSHNDHRIAMAMAIASIKCTDELIITDAGCVSKSYPNFFEDFAVIGGKYNVIKL